jgi:hypothetical protein
MDNNSSPQQAEGHHIAQAQGPGAIANVITNIFRGSTAEQRERSRAAGVERYLPSFGIEGYED